MTVRADMRSVDRAIRGIPETNRGDPVHSEHARAVFRLLPRSRASRLDQRCLTCKSFYGTGRRKNDRWWPTPPLAAESLPCPFEPGELEPTDGAPNSTRVCAPGGPNMSTRRSGDHQRAFAEHAATGRTGGREARVIAVRCPTFRGAWVGWRRPSCRGPGPSWSASTEHAPIGREDRAE